MESKVDCIIIIVLFWVAFMFGFGFSIQTSRLGQTRQQLESVRMELESATDKQQQLREVVSGTREILGESFTTIEGIRSQIAAIRESYEEMENLLYSSDSYSNRIDNLDIKE